MNSHGNRPDLGDEPEQPESTGEAFNAGVPDSSIAPEKGGDPDPAEQARKSWEQLLRTTADFENFKKRATREKQDAVKYASESLLNKLVPVLDNLDMALTAAQQEAPAQNIQALQTGITMIHQQLKQALSEAGLTEIDASGQRFDPNIHEAVSQQESDAVEEGHVLQQLRKGYKLRDRLLRPAMVVVAKNSGS